VRKAATMIELVFTIVILGIAMVTIPTMLSNISKINELSINQEAILAGSTAIGNILTYKWDEKTTDLNVTFSPILDVTHGDNELDRILNTTKRKGSFKGVGRRKFYNQIIYASSTLGSDFSDMDDIDDFIGVKSLTLNSGNVDYILDIEIATNVIYISDINDYNKKNINFVFQTSPHISSTNIKMIEVEVKDKDSNQTIAIYRSFASNIGESKLLSRNYN